MSHLSNSIIYKDLQTRQSKLIAKRKAINNHIVALQSESSQLKKKITSLHDEIESLKMNEDAGIIISEHAMLRYIERVMGIDIPALQEKILPSSQMPTLLPLGNMTLKREDFKLKIVDGVVVSVMVS